MQWRNLYVCVGFFFWGGGATPTQIQGYFHFRQYLGLIRTPIFLGRMVPKLVRRGCASIHLKNPTSAYDTILHTKNISDRVKRRRKPP